MDHRLRTPAEIVVDMRRERIRDAAIVELELGRPSLGRVARRARLDVDIVRDLFPGGIDEILGLASALPVAA